MIKLGSFCVFIFKFKAFVALNAFLTQLRNNARVTLIIIYLLYHDLLGFGRCLVIFMVFEAEFIGKFEMKTLRH